MPNIKSAKKRVRVTSAKTLNNRMFKSQMRTNLKKYTAEIEKKDAAALSQAYKTLDTAVSKGVLHKNAAANKKAKLAALFNA